MDSLINILIRNKKYILFFIAALSLLMTGVFIKEQVDYIEFLFLALSSIVGVFWVYRVNDVIDYDENLQLNLKQFFSNKLHVLFSLIILSLIIFGAFIFSLFQFQLFAFVGLLGFFYSIDFKFFGGSFRLKNIFLFKNLAIGLAWGVLVLIGFGAYNSALSQLFFLLATIQVFIGSMIRDIPDKDKDLKQNVKSFPVVLGLKNTVLFMHIINLSSLFLLFLGPNLFSFIFPIAIVVAWRFINLMMVKKEPFSVFWGQFINLMTCTLILIVALIYNLWN